MNLRKRFSSVSILLLTILLPIHSSAQNEVKVVKTIVYHQPREFNLGDIPSIGKMKISANGSKIILFKTFLELISSKNRGSRARIDAGLQPGKGRGPCRLFLFIVQCHIVSIAEITGI